jgi:hypothetical protein
LNVHDDEIKTVFQHHLDTLATIEGGGHAVSELTQENFEQTKDFIIIVQNQYM